MILGNFKNAPFWFWEIVKEQLSYSSSTFNDGCEHHKTTEMRSEYIIKVRDKEKTDYDFDADGYYYAMPIEDWNNSRLYML